MEKKIILMCPDCGFQAGVTNLDFDVLDCASCRHLIPLRQWFIAIGDAHLTKRAVDGANAGALTRGQMG